MKREEWNAFCDYQLNTRETLSALARCLDGIREGGNPLEVLESTLLEQTRNAERTYSHALCRLEREHPKAIDSGATSGDGQRLPMVESAYKRLSDYRKVLKEGKIPEQSASYYGY